jgi:hypothetical protein
MQPQEVGMQQAEVTVRNDFSWTIIKLFATDFFLDLMDWPYFC